MGATQQGPRSGRRGAAAAERTPGGLAAGPELALAVFAGTPDAVVVVDETGRILEFNPAAEAIFGRSRDEVLGKDIAMLLIPARRRRAYRATLERFARGGDERELRSLHQRATTTALRADGTEFTVESTVVPLMVGGKRLFCEHIRDMSDLAEAASALAASEHRFRLLSTLAPVGILQMNAAGKTVFVNERWCALTGLSADEALLKGWAGVLRPETADRMSDQWENTVTTGQELLAEVELQPGTGTARWVQGAAVPLRDGTGHLIGYLCTITDISERKAAEAERERTLAAEREARRRAAENAERLARFVAALPAAVLVEDERRRIVLTNELFCKIFHITATPQQLVGARSAPVIEDSTQMAADPDGFLRRATQIVAARELVTDEEVALADGRIYDLDYVPVHVGKEWRGQLWMYWDVTERKAFERQRERLLAAELKARKATDVARRRLDEQNQRLRELDELRADFMATLSHELRTPLTSIVSFTELLRDAEDSMSPQSAEFLEIIERNSERLLALISDLLLLGHIEAGSLPLDLAPASVAELAEEAVRARSAPAYRRGVTIEMVTEDGPPVRVDRLRMLQVLDNLLSNAIKFTEPGGTIRVTTHFDGDEWQIEVEDTGIGIPAEEQEKIFQRFFRASNARVEAVPGTGLGLSVVKAIVEMHGGWLNVRSAPGKGTTFSLHLKAGS
jgi:PAS domain S-box-containing protein